MRRALLLFFAFAIAGCSRAPIVFRYPAESMSFPGPGTGQAQLFVDFINDIRPDEERQGEGSFAVARFPADDEWDRPVTQIYYEALVQDLTQTRLIELVPMRSQAEYILEVDLLRLSEKITRSTGSYLMAAAAGGIVGYLVAQSPGGGAAGAVVGLGAMPVPARLEAVAEVRLRLFDAQRAPIWDRTCRGEVSQSIMTNVTARSDQAWVDQQLTVAVKRCNACLLGQLRQMF